MPPSVNVPLKVKGAPSLPDWFAPAFATGAWLLTVMIAVSWSLPLSSSVTVSVAV